LTKAVIFDFDGTLIDSEQAIYQCFQNITKRLAPERMEHAKNILIGPPLRDTASEILGPEHQDSLDKFVHLFIAMHDKHVIKNTQVYPNVNETLEKLHKKNISMAVATNKRKAPTEMIVNHFGWNNFFMFVECSDSKKIIRNKIQMIDDIINQNDIFKNSIFVGDTVNDGLSANNRKVLFIRANYGYGKKQNWKQVKIKQTINNFKELEKII